MCRGRRNVHHLLTQVAIVGVRLPLHLQQHLLLGQVLLLRSGLSLSLPMTALLRHLLLLLLLMQLILLNFLHEEDLLLFSQLLLILTSCIRAIL